MSNQRTAHRWKLLATIVVGTFLAFGSLWLLQVMQRDDGQIGGDPLSKEPDYIVEKFSFVRMTPEGKPRYLFYGAKLTHRPFDDTSLVERPIMQNMTPGEQPMTINALQALIRHQENQVELLGQVDVVRPATGTAQAMRLKTDALTVFPDEDRMSSNSKVEMTLDSSVITGAGMEADNAARQVQFKGRGRIVVPPAAARKASR